MHTTYLGYPTTSFKHHKNITQTLQQVMKLSICNVSIKLQINVLRSLSEHTGVVTLNSVVLLSKENINNTVSS
jgi:hypothetical protein